MVHRVPLFLLFLTLAWLSPVANAEQESSAREKFRAGIQAFQAGNLQRARELLETAAEEISSRALTYNLGVVYYHLGEYDLARLRFESLLPTDQRALARYNLGLIALALENEAAAREAFIATLSEDPDEKLARLAAGQLKEIGQDIKEDNWQALFSLAAGYEENIALFPDSAATSLDDAFLESVNVLSGFPVRRGNHALQTQLLLYGRAYADYGDFDTYLARVNLAWAYLPKAFHYTLGLGGDQLWQGGNDREHRARVFTEYRKSGCFRAFGRDRCLVAVEAEQVDATERYRPYDGQRYRLNTSYKTRFGRWTGDLRYRVDYNDRRDLDTGTEYFSVSPLSQNLLFGLDYTVTPSWTIGASTHYEFRYYQTAHRLTIPEGLWIIHREDNRISWSINSEIEISRSFSVGFELEDVQNNSNIPRYDYDRRTATIDVTVRL
ncbi:hypothetical protein FWJ25_08860 [Marinobacter salinexigens]|uniref:Tetratricopeptide repeat protein n=1 Tax=Marinobacter salinexigens TaxID=2919747 RepID=A0A5B0VI00_9GAMM|nr:tetratricopeptide repeat protein [Marinobacter salinexigens]KAA1174337.1 hypothetical protein FWJ25_08860 [Marinobacter salinexigens]